MLEADILQLSHLMLTYKTCLIFSILGKFNSKLLVVVYVL